MPRDAAPRAQDLMQSLTGDEPHLGLGDFGEWVSELQSRLRGLGHLDGPPDGTYDMRTESAVRMLQSAVGLDNDGQMSLPVWQALLQQEQFYGLEYNRFAGPLNQEWDKPGWAQRQWGDQQWVAQQSAAAEQWSGPLNQGVSDDGRWLWDGMQWVANDAGLDASVASGGQVSEDGLWRWDGIQWQDALAFSGGSDAAGGQLSDDGHWRWNGFEWQDAQSGSGASGSGASGGQLSDDGRWQWDGSQWRTV